MPRETQDRSYTDQLLREEGAWWKRVLDVQRLYRWNLRRLQPGLVLDVGCGLGRNLAHLGGHGVGIDHNADSIAICRARGFEAYLPEEFDRQPVARRFDTLLLSHVVEHMTSAEAAALIRTYVPHLREHGRVILITPQEYGFRADATHVEFVDHAVARRILDLSGADVVVQRSFPLPHRIFGRLFRYNEFVSVGELRGTSSS
jgi:SAM-dependent methyltransferase